jgi:hypothetical protein
VRRIISVRRYESLDALSTFLQVLREKGLLEPGQSKGLEKHVRRLRHALQVKDITAVRKAVNDLARIFVQVGSEKRADRDDKS